MRTFDARIANRSAAVLYLAGAVLLFAVAVADDPDPREAVLVLAALSVLAGLGLATVDRAQRSSLELAFAAELLALAAVAVLVLVTGGASSPYTPYHLLGVVHAAVFQPLWRAAAAGAIGVGALLAPLAYDETPQRFAEVALVGLLPAVIVAAVVHLAVQTLRQQRRQLALREAEALRIAESDELTGIGNYRRFWRQLESETARARRHDQPFSLIVLDLDGFKAINDELGHQAGDEALRRVARALESKLRTEDVLCRQGGDEFGVIAVAAGEREARDLARRLVDAVAETAGHGLDHPLSASAGWATFGRPERTADGLLAVADRALREAKVEGRPGRPAPPPSASAGREAIGMPSAVRATERRAPRDPRLAALSACSRALALAEDERAVVQIAVVHVSEALEAGVVEVWRRRDDGTPALVARGHYAGVEAPAPTVEAIDPGRLEEVIDTNHVLDLGDEGLLVPISHEGRAEGVLVVRGSGRGRPGLKERRLALAMAAQIGRALAAAEARRTHERDGESEVERLARAAGAAVSAERVAELAVAAGRRAGLEGEALETLRDAAMLHNVGMIGVPAGLPLRPAPLGPEEVAIVREAPIIAERLVRAIPHLEDVAWVVRHAHERYDGTGYPDRLAGESIPLASRVLHAAIALEAMLSPRPWRPALSEAEARAEMRRAAGGQLDPDAVEAVLGALDERAPEWRRPSPAANN
jgi:diguanylate cyclase (GGDEF)-like protein